MKFLEMNYLYSFVEAFRLQSSPVRTGILAAQEWFSDSFNPYNNSEFSKTMKAILEIQERFTRRYAKPEFDIKTAVAEGRHYVVKESVVIKKPFCNVLHFEKLDFPHVQPKLLVVAPLSGHHATLLRGTVQDLLPFVDVYITDWIDASQVPLKEGEFDLDSYINYIIDFLTTLGKGIHVLAVCQPTVPVLAAASIMSSEKSDFIPKSMTLIGGPIDARKRPTDVNTFATEHNLAWFSKNVITSVPYNYPGFMRKVYPGFLQLLGFISLDPERHINSHIDLFNNLLIEDEGNAEVQKKFYDEYLSAMDMPAEFYLQTIKEVFHDFSLASGKMVSKGRKVKLSYITDIPLLGIEGEKDNIAAVGQTKAALNLCKELPQEKRHYYMQPRVGHYGSFTGSKFRSYIVPVIRDFIYLYS